MVPRAKKGTIIERKGPNLGRKSKGGGTGKEEYSENTTKANNPLRKAA